jgi:hypothetical protein
MYALKVCGPYSVDAPWNRKFIAHAFRCLDKLFPHKQAKEIGRASSTALHKIRKIICSVLYTNLPILEYANSMHGPVEENEK